MSPHRDGLREDDLRLRHELSNALATAFLSVEVARHHPGVQSSATQLLDAIERQLEKVSELTGLRWTTEGVVDDA